MAPAIPKLKAMMGLIFKKANTITRTGIKKSIGEI